MTVTQLDRAATLVHSVDGVNVTKTITRQVFPSPIPSCVS